jgi:hypothetical protein
MEAEVAVAESAPVSSSTESSATATPEPSARPSTALKAFEQVTAPSSDTDTAATAPDETGVVSPSTSEKEGPIPFKAHHTALANAREKAVAEWKEKFGWAETLDRQAVEQAARLGQLYSTDRAGYVRQLLSEAVTDPDLAPVVRSEAARILAGSRQSAPDPLPDFPIIDGEGNTVASLAEVINRHVAAALDKEVKPLKQDFESRQQHEQHEKAEAAKTAAVDDIFTEAIDVLPQFEKHKTEIAKVFATLPIDGSPGSTAKALRQAWKQVVGPTLTADATADVLNTFKTKANAQTVDGSGKAASTPKRPTNPKELAVYMRQIATG